MKIAQDIKENSVKLIYFVGIKGVGMASLAILSHEAGFEVSGSDVPEVYLTDEVLSKNNIHIDSSFEKKFLEKFIQDKPEECLVITTAAHDGLLNPQCVFSKSLKIPVLTHGQAVGYFMDGALFHREFQGISILGCHGKTTITGMVTSSLSSLGVDPSYTLGSSEVFPLGNSGHFGSGKYFVAEADEFVSDLQKDKTVKFFYQHPKYAIINNIDFDHPDVYKDLEEVCLAFEKFAAENIQKYGMAILNGDDKNVSRVREVLQSLRRDVKVVTYGEKDNNDFQIQNFKENGWGSEFDVFKDGETIGTFSLSVPGYHNAKNALSVIALLDSMEVSYSEIAKAIKEFKGTKRRQEKVGVTKGGAIIIDDYAHHPDEIDKTLTAVKNAYPNKNIVCLFQPHTLSRTVALKNEFSQAFKSAEKVIFLPIFTSKREKEVTYDELYKEIKETMEKNGKKVMFFKDERTPEDLSYSPYFFPKYRQPVVKYLTTTFGTKDNVIVTLGAGDLYRISYDLVNS